MELNAEKWSPGVLGVILLYLYLLRWNSVGWVVRTTKKLLDGSQPKGEWARGQEGTLNLVHIRIKGRVQGFLKNHFSQHCEIRFIAHWCLFLNNPDLLFSCAISLIINRTYCIYIFGSGIVLLVSCKTWFTIKLMYCWVLVEVFVLLVAYCLHVYKGFYCCSWKWS